MTDEPKIPHYVKRAIARLHGDLVLVRQCSAIVAVGRLRWIEGTKMKGKDNCAWHRFDVNHTGGPRFVGWQMEAA